jgi:hypothetical protein
VLPGRFYYAVKVLQQIQLGQIAHPTLLMKETGSGRKECLWVDSGLFQNGAKRPLGHIARMVGHRRILIGRGTEPDFVAASCLTIEFKAARFQFPANLPIAEP